MQLTVLFSRPACSSTMMPEATASSEKFMSTKLHGGSPLKKIILVATVDT